MGLRVTFSSALQNGFNIHLLHRLTNLPVNHGATVAIKNRAKIVDGSDNVQIRDVNVPMAMRDIGLNKPFAFFRRFGIPSTKQTGSTQHTIGRRGAHTNDVLIEHHKAEPSVAFEGVLLIEVQNGLSLPWFDPILPT
jgi:hypothetical protein